MSSARVKPVTKRPYERAIKISVSMPGILFDSGSDRMRQHGLTQFSHYVQLLVRRDTGTGTTTQ